MINRGQESPHIIPTLHLQIGKNPQAFRLKTDQAGHPIDPRIIPSLHLEIGIKPQAFRLKTDQAGHPIGLITEVKIAPAPLGDFILRC